MSNVSAIIDAIKSGRTTALENTEKTLEKIKKSNGRINAFLEIFEHSAITRAKEIDEKQKNGKPLGKLAGVAIAVKDNILFEGHIASCGSKILANHKAVYNSGVVEKLLAEDAIIIGRTNMDEFAMGSSTENSAYGPTKNPLDLTRVAGGSSGGSAAAVASGMVPLALGSETSDSIRQPAAFCGIVGLKPTYGRVSRYGLVAFASSLDQIGPMAGNVCGCAKLFSIIAGNDPRDETCADIPAKDYLTEAHKIDIKNLKIGLAKEYFASGQDSEISSAVESVANKLSNKGAKITYVNMPHTKYAIAAYYIIAPSEASSNLARFDGIRYGLSDKDCTNLKDVYTKTRSKGFGAEVKRRIMLGTYALSGGYYDAYYQKAQKVRMLIKKDFEQAFKKVDLILSPTTAEPAFRLGEKTTDPIKMYLSDVYCAPSSLAGVCAISIACGKTKNGLPIGIQFIANHFEEEKLFAAGLLAEGLNV